MYCWIGQSVMVLLHVWAIHLRLARKFAHAVPLCSLPSDLWRVTALDRLDLSGNLFSGV